ncbi:tetratricopeptide repeat protein [Rhodospirillum centenum]|uniref:TPR domain protein, putative n=1 Tax=Rhodospirillum centenum (strain ATCC 51521 / SW) TaxID=414684 RepID=B6IW70_RHOCS|nr:tetratricopeptide repeat protein [Rhodospirillum centenum]ACJ00544.1 TPR domain protein, putative [Rhodospirillum centenum SW]
MGQAGITRSGRHGIRGGSRSAAVLALLAALALPVLAGGTRAEPDKATSGADAAADRLSGEAMASYLSGRVAQNAGDGKAAARLLSEALAHDPDNPELRRRAFLVNLSEGNMTGALPLARRAVEDGRGTFAAHALLVADDIAAGRTKEARARLAALPADGPGRLVAPLATAWTEVAAGNPDAALAALETLDKLGGAPGFTALRHFQTALIEDLRGNADAAAAAYVQALADGMPLRPVLLAGNFYERQGRPDQARALYAAFLAENPESPALEQTLARLEAGGTPPRLVADARDGLAEALFDMAAGLHREGAADAALIFARIALHLKPQQPLARMMVGDILMARERPQDALEEYRAVTGDPAVGWAARLREADALHRAGHADEAVPMLEAMAAERPGRTDALLELGDIHRIAGRYAAAVAAYDRAAARLPAGEPGRRDWVLYFARGMSLEGEGRWPEAEADLRRALALNPDHPSILNFLGYGWADRGIHLEEARALLEKAVALHPDNGHIMDSLGWALFRQGEIPRAVETLERAAELQPFEPEINDHLGDAYWVAGRRTEARFQWRRAAQQAEDDTLRHTAEAKLKDGLPLPRTAGTAPATP